LPADFLWTTRFVRRKVKQIFFRHVKRTISSSFQSHFKMLTLVFIVLVGGGFIAGCLNTGRILWDALFLPGGLLALCLWFSISRKTVQMDDRFLYVSVFRRVVSIPLEQISTVTESIGTIDKDRSVTIHFRSNTPFGRSITFTPTFMFTRDPHPVVVELLAHANTGET
jgi:hypothetical protein